MKPSSSPKISLRLLPLILLALLFLTTPGNSSLQSSFPRLLDYFAPYLDDWEIATSLLDTRPEESRQLFGELFEKAGKDRAHLVQAELDLLGRVMVAAELLAQGERPPERLFAPSLRGDLSNSLGLVEVEVLVGEGNETRYEKRLVSLARCWKELDRYREKLHRSLREMDPEEESSAPLELLELIVAPPGFPELSGKLVREMKREQEEELWLRQLFAPLREPLLRIASRLSQKLAQRENLPDELRKKLVQLSALSLKLASESAIPLANLIRPPGG